jgi:hypothetical protein
MLEPQNTTFEVKMGSSDVKPAIERMLLGSHRTKLDVDKLIKESYL